MKHIHNPIRGFIAGLLALPGLVCLALLCLTGCSDVLKPIPAGPETGSPGAPPFAAAGTGRLTITLTGTGGGERTLFPTAPESFSKYELGFTPKSGQAGIAPVMFTDGTSHSLALTTGDWTITAAAYIRIQDIAGIADGDYAAARGSKDVTVSTVDVSETIDLRGGVDGEGRGVFSYDIALPDGLDSASLEMLDLEGNPVKWVDLKAAPSGAFALDSGYYLLKISRAKGGNTTVRAEAAHIYTALTTEASGPGYDFTGFGSAAEILGFLSAQPANTAGSPYTVVLSRRLDLETDLGKGGDPLGLLYETLAGKYVRLDLSACGGDIPGVYEDTASNRPNRDKIVSLILPDSLTSIGWYAFSGCTSLEAIDLPDTLTEIGEGAFYGCTTLTAIDLPDSITEIGRYAFRDCTTLTAIDLPDSITEIGHMAFYGCTTLASIDLPESLTSIGEWAFYGCTTLAAIDLPDSLTEIGEYAFSDCSSLTAIDLPDSLTEIGESAFSWCSSLASIGLPDSLAGIGAWAFAYCTSLAAIDLPDSITEIGGSAFGGCTSLAAIDLPDSLAEIGESAFYNCTSLASIDLPDSLTEIGGSAFYNCTTLASIDLPESLTSIGEWAFYGCTTLAAIDLPDALTSIGDRAFRGCTFLAAIDLPDSLTSIEREAFRDCTSLAAIDLPVSLTTIGEGAFTDCMSLAVVISRNTTPPELEYTGDGYSPFVYTPASLLFYVPDTSVAAYKSAWSDHAGRIKPLSQLP